MDHTSEQRDKLSEALQVLANPEYKPEVSDYLDAMALRHPEAAVKLERARALATLTLVPFRSVFLLTITTVSNRNEAKLVTLKLSNTPPTPKPTATLARELAWSEMLIISYPTEHF